ncbi:MAG: hypothetical protein NTZ48_00210, partial [Candidatus Omnitrophica bacterium]|nr:hypothetical protein [Candidatus Omnitrophota bacterium]
MHARLNAQDRQYHNNSQFIAENSLLRTDPTVQENPVAFSNEKYLLDVIKRKPISREVTNAIK